MNDLQLFESDNLIQENFLSIYGGKLCNLSASAVGGLVKITNHPEMISDS